MALVVTVSRIPKKDVSGQGVVLVSFKFCLGLLSWHCSKVPLFSDQLTLKKESTDNTDIEKPQERKRDTVATYREREIESESQSGRE